MSDVKLLKKYANRRLYDTEQSAYVTLEQIAEAIKQGREVKVTDAQTGEDVTSFILTQIILEQSRKHTLLPAPLLHLIIRYGDNLLSEFFEKYLQQTIESYLQYRAAMDEQFKQWLNLGMEMTETTQQNIIRNLSRSPFMYPFADREDQENRNDS
jgi:polyhydroxyalkanoate synthesis repressor PhaR